MGLFLRTGPLYYKQGIPNGIYFITPKGRVLRYHNEDTPEATLSRDGIAAGSYVIQVRDKVTGNTMEKQVVFE